MDQWEVLPLRITDCAFCLTCFTINAFVNIVHDENVNEMHCVTKTVAHKRSFACIEVECGCSEKHSSLYFMLAA